jgi:hypothetical protein
MYAIDEFFLFAPELSQVIFWDAALEVSLGV